MMRSSKLNRGALGALALLSTFIGFAGVAQAQTKGVIVAPTAPAPSAVKEVVHELGNYDPLPATHAAYALEMLPPSAGMLAPINGPNIDPCPSPQLTYDWDREFKKADEFGNNTFGAGYYAGVTFSSRAGRAGGADSFSGEALLRGYITVFNTDKDLVRISGKAQLVGNQGTSSYYVRVLGTTVKSASVTGNLTGNESIANATFFSASKWIWLGPVPVKFTGAVKGTLGLTYAAGYATSTITAETRPNAQLYAYASAGVDMWFASAGVSGTLTLVEAGLPSKVYAVVQPNAIAWGLDSDLTLSSLSGHVDAYATLAGERWNMTLASWSPLYQGTFPIKHLRSCQNPIVRPVCGDNTCQSGETHDNCPHDCAAPPPPPPGSDDGDLPLYCQAKPWMCQDP